MATEYEGLDLAELQSEYQRVSAEPGATSNGDDYLQKFVRLPERDGYTLMRILPKKKGGKIWCATRVHTLVNPTTKSKRTFHCPKNLMHTAKGERWEGECIICKVYSDTWQKSESLHGKAQEDCRTAARALKPVERYYYNVIVRSERDKDGNIKKNVGPKIYSCGKTVHTKILRAILGDESAGEKPLGDVTHPTTGRDFRVVKKVVKGGGGAEYPNYDNSKFDDVSPAGSPEELSTWMENLNDLQALRVIKTPDELKHALRVHLGMIKEGDSSGDDELSEFRQAGKPTSSVSNTEKIREELAVTTSESKASSTDEDDEPMADDDFMKQLESM